jgi:predicted ATPase
VHGWALAHTGKTADGLAELQTAIADSVRIMGHVAMPHFMAMLAEVLIFRGEHARALDEIQRILTVNKSTRDEYFDAELHRLAGECHLALGEPDAAVAALEQAVEIARQQKALTFQLRATTALARFWLEQDQQDKARAALQHVLTAFRDAEENVDVRRARALLADLDRVGPVR